MMLKAQHSATEDHEEDNVCVNCKALHTRRSLLAFHYSSHAKGAAWQKEHQDEHCEIMQQIPLLDPKLFIPSKVFDSCTLPHFAFHVCLVPVCCYCIIATIQ
jgi:hypothetical protein